MADKRPAAPLDDSLLSTEHQELHPALVFLGKNIKYIAMGIGGLLLAVALASGYRAWSASELAQARDELGNIVAVRGQARLTGLQDFAAQAPTALRPAALYELALAADEEADHATALEAFRQLRDATSGELRAVAELGMARALMASGEPAQAAQGLKAAMPAVPEAYKPIMTRERALAAEAAGQLVEALAAYEALRTLEPGNEEFITAKTAALKAKLAQADSAAPAS